MQHTELTAIAQAVERMRERIPLSDASGRHAMLETLTQYRDLSGSILDAWMAVDDAIEEAVREIAYYDDMFEESEQDEPMVAHKMNDSSLSGSVMERTPDFNVQPVELAETWFDLSLKGECLLRKGLAYYDLEMFEEAAKTLSGAVNEQDVPGARIYLALSFLASGEVSQAALHLEAARYMAKDDTTLQAVLEAEVQMYSIEENWSRALRTLYELLAYEPDMGDTWFNIGICHMHLYEFGAAERCFAQSMQCKDDECATLWRAFTLSLLDQRDLAVELLTRLNDRETAYHELRSTVYLAVGMMEEAIHHAAQIGEAESTAALTALCLVLNKRYRSATLQLKRHLVLYPHDHQATVLFGICSYFTGDLSRARKAFATAKSFTQSSAFIELILARMDMISGAFDSAIHRVRTLSEDARIPVRRLAVLYLGMLHLLQGNDEEAQVCFRRSKQLGFDQDVIALAISKTKSMVPQV